MVTGDARHCISGVTRPPEPSTVKVPSGPGDESRCRRPAVQRRGRRRRGAQRAGGAGEQLGHPARGDDCAVGDDDEMVDGGLHLVEQVAGQQHRAPTRRRNRQQHAHPGDALGVESVRWFVQDQHLRVTHEGLGDPEPLAHAQGVGTHPPGGGVGEPDQVQQLVDSACTRRRPFVRRSSAWPGRFAQRAWRRDRAVFRPRGSGLGRSTKGWPPIVAVP